MRVAPGSGATLSLRLRGIGRDAFRRGEGAELDSPLTETTPAGSATGDLGALTSISGTVDCGDQQAGTTTVVVSGTTPFGQLSGPR